MDFSRSSSVYSTDTSGKATQGVKKSAGSLEPSPLPSRGPSTAHTRTESSSTVHAPLTPRESTPSSTHSQTSSRPSFMNYQNGAAAESLKRKPIPPQRANQPSVPEGANGIATTAGGTLVVFIGGVEVHSATIRYLGIALQRRRYDYIGIVGSEILAATLKQLKIDVYGLIGKFGRETGVQVSLLANFSGESITRAIEEVCKSGMAKGVLCEITYGDSDAADLLSIDGNEFGITWEKSVRLLHAVARATVPMLSSATPLQLDQPAFFLVLDYPVQDMVSSFYKTACDSLLRSLRDQFSHGNLTIGHAANVLIPRPEPIDTNGNDKTPVGVSEGEPLELTPGESPTKLWNMWAMHEQLGDS